MAHVSQSEASGSIFMRCECCPKGEGIFRLACSAGLIEDGDGNNVACEEPGKRRTLIRDKEQLERCRSM